MPLQKRTYLYSLSTFIIFLILLSVLYNISNIDSTKNKVLLDSIAQNASASEPLVGSSPDSLTILMYHELSEDDAITKNDFSIPFKNFKDQMHFLKLNQYSTLSLDELYQFLEFKTPLPKKSVVITFDDGYRNVYRLAYPLLKELNYSAAAFLIVSSIAGTKDIAEKSNRITLDEINKIKDVFDIGSHTYNMHNMRNGKSLLLTESLTSVFYDVSTSKTLLNTKYFAYPYGQFNVDIIKQLAAAGYTLAFSTRPGIVFSHCNHYEIPRINVSPTMTIEQFSKVVCNRTTIQ